MKRSSRQKANKKTLALNDTRDDTDLINIHKTLYPKAENYTFLSSVQRTFFWMDHILGHKICLSKLKNTKS